MSLVYCPECNGSVSDKAEACPNCGYPRPGEASITKDRNQTGSETLYHRNRYGMLQPTTTEEPSPNGESLTKSEWRVRTKKDNEHRIAEDKRNPKAREERLKEFNEYVDTVIQVKIKRETSKSALRENKKPLDIRVGRIVKTRVRIDSEKVAFGRQSIRCKSVVACGWWAQTTKNLEWGRGEWTTGWIWLRSKDKKIKITVPGAHDFQVIIDKIWTFIAIRILWEIASNLDQDVDLSLCGLEMNGKGLKLRKLGFGAEIVPWKKVKNITVDGELRISSKTDKHRKTSLSFRRTDNLPILAALLELRRKKLIRRLTWTESLMDG